VPERADPRDCLVGSTLEDLPPGGLVATGSVRRRAQLADRRPDLGFTGLRGNIQTRLEKASGFSAIVMAAAALSRLGLEDRIAEVLEPGVMVPQVAQGALAVECREDDDATREALAAIEHGPSRRAVDTERAYLASLGGGCDLPVGAHATVAADGSLRVRGLMATLDGRVVLRDELAVTAADAAADAGSTLARRLLDAGGSWLLEEAGMAPGPQGAGGRSPT
jgi:hydroxymethylbilane synthase